MALLKLLSVMRSGELNVKSFELIAENFVEVHRQEMVVVC